MGNIVVSENITLDGVTEDPTGEDGFRYGGWFNELGDGDRAAWAEVLTGEALSSAAMLLGRRSYEYLAARWPSRTGVWADRLNSMPKYVVSATLTDPEWTNTTVLAGDLVKEVARLRQELPGDIVVAASGQLVPALFAHDLVDEVRLIVYPHLLGAGGRVFDGIGDRKRVRLVEACKVGTGLALLTYRVVPGRGVTRPVS
jgi:dihydrofolate reductase